MLIPSKLSRPVRLQNTVMRDRLLVKLSGVANYRLTLINCPAGYGKTTLIAQWAADQSDLGWYSLDESDNQPERFATYLIAAVQQATGGHCSKSEALNSVRSTNMPVSPRYLLSYLSNYLIGMARFIW